MVKDKRVTEASMSKQSSQSSVASNDSILSTGSLERGFELTESKRGIFGKHGKYNFGFKNKKNKISKHDFYNKTPEFRMWLTEEKSLNLDELPTNKAKELFKKFVKKWNKKNLAQKYYAGSDPLWSVASPSSYSRVAVQSDDDTTVESNGPSPAVSPTPSVFSTFGKRSGLRMLKKLQENPYKEEQSPKGVPENVYDELIFGKASFQRPKSGFASPSKSIPLCQLFQNPENTPTNSRRPGTSPVCTPVANPILPCTDVNHYSEPCSPPFPPPPPPEDLVIPGPTFFPPPPPPGEASTKTSPIYAQPQIKKTSMTENRTTLRSKSRENIGRPNSCVDSPSLRMPPPPPPPPRSRSMQFDHGTFSLPTDRPLTRSRSRESICSISSVVSEPAYNMGGRVGRSSSRRRPPPPPPKRTDSLRSVNSDVSYKRCGPPLTATSLSSSGTMTRTRSRESLVSVTSDLGSSLGMSDRQSLRYGSQQSIQSAMSTTSQSSQVLPDAGSPAKLPKRGPSRKGNAPPPPSFASTKDIKGYASIKKKRPSIHLARSLEDISTKVLSTANTAATKDDIKKFKKDERFDRTSSSWTKPILV